MSDNALRSRDDHATRSTTPTKTPVSYTSFVSSCSNKRDLSVLWSEDERVAYHDIARRAAAERMQVYRLAQVASEIFVQRVGFQELATDALVHSSKQTVSRHNGDLSARGLVAQEQ